MLDDPHCCKRCPPGYRCDRCVNAILDAKNAAAREAHEYLARAGAAEAECARLGLPLAGEEKARALLMKGMRSQCELMDDLKQEVRRLRAENEALRQQVRGHCDRIAAQAELLARRAERPGETP